MKRQYDKVTLVSSGLLAPKCVCYHAFAHVHDLPYQHVPLPRVPTQVLDAA